MYMITYRSDFQVITDVHSIHIFLWDCVSAVQVSQQACRLTEQKKRNTNGYRSRL